MPTKQSTTKKQSKNEKQGVEEKELQAIESPKGKLTLVDTPITQKQILTIFQKTPAEHIHNRPAKGGGNWDYVTGVYVKKVLNYTFGWLWDFEVIDKGEVKAGTKIVQIWVQGRLTIRDPKTHEPIIIKTQFGGADVKYMKSNANQPLDYANDMKAAATDALKKCASELGIASDIYGKNEFKEINVNRPAVKQTKPQPAGKATPKTNVDYLAKLKDELRKRGADSLPEALAIYNKITGESIKSFNIAQTTAQKYLFSLLNSPMGK
ncbi:MAG TPA: Rad52/Rad22 family DNA repair protein [Syntrophales bacterium]|nr:Rad52/Rad22 family DNA repair protein [Syntrophales bacterium]